MDTPGSVLVDAVRAATAECVALMNEQFIAVTTNQTRADKLDEKIAKAIRQRKRAMDDLINHVQVYGW